MSFEKVFIHFIVKCAKSFLLPHALIDGLEKTLCLIMCSHLDKPVYMTCRFVTIILLQFGWAMSQNWEGNNLNLGTLYGITYDSGYVASENALFVGIQSSFPPSVEFADTLGQKRVVFLPFQGLLDVRQKRTFLGFFPTYGLFFSQMYD